MIPAMLYFSTGYTRVVGPVTLPVVIKEETENFTKLVFE